MEEKTTKLGKPANRRITGQIMMTATVFLFVVDGVKVGEVVVLVMVKQRKGGAAMDNRCQG